MRRKREEKYKIATEQIEDVKKDKKKLVNNKLKEIKSITKKRLSYEDTCI
jgi:hypothetical protein